MAIEHAASAADILAHRRISELLDDGPRQVKHVTQPAAAAPVRKVEMKPYPIAAAFQRGGRPILGQLACTAVSAQPLRQPRQSGIIDKVYEK